MELWSWGANAKGQLGHDFASEQISRPTRVKNSKITDLLSSIDTTGMPIQIDGGGTETLICFDGIQDTSCSQEPIKSILVKIGKSHSSSDGTSLKDINENEFDPCIISRDLKIREISCGWDFNLILSSDNKIYSWGCDNKYGQLGRELHSARIDEIEEIEHFLAVKISTGLRRAAAIGLDGHLYIWGDNSKSDLGVGSNADKIIRKPTRVILDNSGVIPRFVNVKCGKSFTIALDDRGQFWGCGDNRFCQLGNTPNLGIGNTMTTFTKLLYFNSDEQMKVRQFECGWNHVLILLENGKVLSFGRNNFGQLGRSEESSSKFVVGLPGNIVSIATGSEHNLALTESGTVYCWGWNEHESCGVESTKVSVSEPSEIPRDSVITPTLLRFTEGTGTIALIACGAGNGFALSKDE